MRLMSWLVLFLGACGLGPGVATGPGPGSHILHSHNDYLQPRPLTTALALGFGSAEADVFLVDGELCVGHERWQVRPGRTLRRLYLEPLQAAAAAGGGRLRGDGQPFVLLVDIKADAAAVWAALQVELDAFAPLLTRFVDGRVEPGAVTVLLSGDRPVRQVAAAPDRRCAIDGRLADLDAVPPPPAELVPWISAPWRAHSDWDGKDEFTAAERDRLAALIARVHGQGRELRFWGAPDRVEAWTLFAALGVDRIGTDRPAAAATWARSR